MRKRVIKVIGIILGVFLLLLVALFLHLKDVSKKTPVNNIQLARIDFIEKPDSLNAAKIALWVRQQTGVQSTFFNIPDGILVYTYIQGQQSAANVYKKLTTNCDFKAKRYLVSVSQTSQGCPAGVKQSWLMKWITSI